MSLRLVLAGLLVAPALLATPSIAAAASSSCADAVSGGFGCFLTTEAASAPDAAPAGYGPKDLRSAYKLPATGGTGETVAIVDAYNDPSAAADLKVYRSEFGLPACTPATGCLSIVNQTGGSTLPANNTGWAAEISLDLDMVSAVCGHCSILLVEANSAATKDLYAAVDEAVALGAKFVSTSWGGPETAGETANDVHFNHPGVAITASAGSGAPDYPGASRYVTAAGATTLTPATNARGWSESAYGGPGSGCSAYESQPTWQAGVVTGCTRRAVADVAAVGDPSTGVAVYETYGASGWIVDGGDSVPPPIIAGVFALAGVPAAGGYPASLPYAHPTKLFDITTGSGAAPGWDPPTGLGTPDGTGAF